ncbi:LppM family (lipo)protein [Zafaria sp. Z1313]|uniref:LppM family (lipo)protein n=1 Tax=unclassified Zafaria TaxID=2828765 RepID=UPI002E76D3D4|nr:hypothetical protein [Zafaria sp. J156]MEE1621998.1 hypothetical protein [Zafaria sp. J156]
MSRKLRILIPLLAAVFVLSGCVRLGIDLVVHDPASADASLVFAVNRDVLDGQSVEDLLGQLPGGSDPFQGLPADAVREAHEEDGYTGYRFTAEGFSLAEAAAVDGGALEGARLEHRDGRFRFTATTAASGAELEQARAVFNEARLSSTFPGRVLEASDGAAVEGNIVVFDLTAGGALHAVAEDTGRGIPGGVLAGVGAAVLAGLAGFAALKLAAERRRRRGGLPPRGGESQPAADDGPRPEARSGRGGGLF